MPEHHAEGRDVAVVTGASRGIGRAIADALAAAGFRVARVDREDGPAPSDGGASYALDVSRIEDHASFLARVAAELGEPTCLVNNAGVTSLVRGDPLDLTPDSYDRTLGVNLRAGFFLAQAFARRRLAAPPVPRASIVFIGSANAEVVGENRADYCISKAGVAMAAKLFAARLARHGIAVFEVRPGVIRTEMTRPAAARYDALIAGGAVPMGRWGEAEDVARAVAALATGAIPYATGIHIDVGGGMQLHRI